MEAWLSKPYNKKILCEACSQRCILEDGEVGICGVRKVENGKLKLLVYDLVSAINIDPIEKKPLYHFLPNTPVLSLGTVGCNFSCKFCQNFDISQYPKEHNGEIIGQRVTAKEIVEIANRRAIPSIAYTYNEPIIFFEYAYEIAKLAKEYQIKNIFVTSGYETHKAIDTISPFLDALNIDLKSFSNNFYKDICGAKLKPVLDLIEYSYKKGLWIEITTLLIPNLNDSDEEIRKIAKFISSIDKNIPWHISAFFPTYKMRDRERTPLNTLLRAYDIGKSEGLNFIYLGNVNDYIHQSTFCPNCQELLIKRNGYYLSIQNLDKNRCKKCETPIAGIF